MKKQKALLFFPLSMSNLNSGITKKCLGIAEAFKSVYDVDIMNEYAGEVFFNGNKLKDYNAGINRMRLYYYNDIIFGQYATIKDSILRNKYDVVYIRLHYFITPGLLHFLRRLKRANNSVSIYIEIPTFPFKKEFSANLHRLRNILNHFTIPFLRKYVTNIITLSAHEQIWGIPTIRISNGFSQDIINEKSIELQPPANDRIFHIAMIAQFSEWHAADILIESLRVYKTKGLEKKIQIHFVGKVLSSTTQQVKEEELEEDVIFHGQMDSRQILLFLNDMHVCVGTLGHHRKNIQLDSSLKNREYAFSGMPMVLKTPDMDFPPALFFIKYFPDDETLLDLQEVINFYKNLMDKNPTYKKDIIEYAKANLTWEKKLRKILVTDSQMKS